MRTTALVAFLMLAACDQPPSGNPPAAPSLPQPAVDASQLPGAQRPSAPIAAVEGWEISSTAYSLIGATLPAFAGKLAYDEMFSAESLRNKWTILGVWPAAGAPEDEATFAAALASAVNQDPALDLLIIHQAADATPPGNPVWPRLTDDGTALAALQLPQTPAYLLIGPDLTIEGYRGALTTSTDDGIKSVIQGVAEIKKQVSAPQ